MAGKDLSVDFENGIVSYRALNSTRGEYESIQCRFSQIRNMYVKHYSSWGTDLFQGLLGVAIMGYSSESVSNGNMWFLIGVAYAIFSFYSARDNFIGRSLMYINDELIADSKGFNRQWEQWAKDTEKAIALMK